MSIEEALELIEEAYVQQDIEALTPKDRLLFWSNLKEYQRAKIQRIPNEPIGADQIQIHISYDKDDYKDEGDI